MTFLFGFALAALVFVGAPYFAHRLRRRRAETRGFAPAHLVPAAPPQARRRSQLEDRSLFFVRALAVVGLALLGASPFVTCSRLSLSRRGGASLALAIVLDDSLSMQAKLGDTPRFARAKKGATELLASTREGDAVAIVLAGAPSRVALAPTTDLGAVRRLLETLPESDRATDLDGALSLARGLLDGLPQVDRRVVVLSDLADGNPDGQPLGEGSAIPLWNALPEIRADGSDCAVIRADRTGLRIRVRTACTPGAERPARTVAITEAGKVLVKGSVPKTPTGDVALMLPSDRASVSEEPGVLMAHLLEPDAIAADDSAPVVAEAAPGSIAVVVEADSETAATGGAPVVEQALAALQLDVTVRPLPQIPNRAEDLSAFVGVLLDDPPGLTPEERRALAAFVERGGLVLMALGSHAATPPLGASFEPFLSHPVTWAPTKAPGGKGVEPASADGTLAESAASLLDLGAAQRVELQADDAARFTPMLTWKDRAPLIARRTIGRGEVWVVTLPFALDASDLPLRAAFLSLLDAWVTTARGRTVARRTVVGATWTFPDARTIVIEGPGGHDNVSLGRENGGAPLEVTPARIGVHRVHADGHTEVRVAEASPREVDLRPRKLAVTAGGKGLGDNHAALDASPVVAVGLLALLTLELALRILAGRRAMRQRSSQSAPLGLHSAP